MSYVQNGFKPDTCWAGTSRNSIVSDLIKTSDDTTRKNLMIVAQGGSVERELSPTVTFGDFGPSNDTIYPIRVMSGYLKAEPNGKRYTVSIPNREMFDVFARATNEQLGADADDCVRRFSEAVLNGDADVMELELYNILAGSVNVRLLSYEVPYQTLILGLLMGLSGRYRVSGDFESGKGYHDIRLEDRKGIGPNIVMEIKTRKPSSAKKQAEKALQQIKDKDYAHGLKGETILYGICFDGETPVIASDRITG